MRRVGLVVATCFLAAACGSSDSATPSRTSSPSPIPTPTVSKAAATELMWEGVRTNDVDKVRTAAQFADLEDRRDHNRTPLIEATKHNRIEVARVLLEAGADPDAKDEIDDSAFLYAGAEGFTEILAMTIEHGANPKSLNRFRGTALIPASEHAHVEAVRLLIEAGVPVNHVNDLGWTALHEAIVLGNGDADHVKVVKMLLEAGADVTIRDKNGVLPRRLAQQRGQTAIVAAIDASVI